MQEIGYNAWIHQTKEWAVVLSTHTGEYYNLGYSTFAPDGTRLTSFNQAKLMLSSDVRKKLWPQILSAMSELIRIISPEKLLRVQPNGTEDHQRHHEFTEMLLTNNYHLSQSWVANEQLHRMYIKD
jgi:hypothetical protein